MSKSSVVPALVLALMLAGASSSRAQEGCQQTRQGVILEGHQALVFYLGGIPDAGLSLHLAVYGDGHSRGVARITDGTSNTIMVSEGSLDLSCDDINGDGVAGITGIQIEIRDVRTGAVVPLALAPVDGEIDEGLEQLAVTIAGATSVGTANIVGLASDTLVGPFSRLGTRFTVAADDGQIDLGSWSKVSGLDVTFDVVDYRSEGGTITLHRVVSSDTPLVQAWLAELAESPQPTTLTISMLDATGESVVRWTFINAYPTKWEVSGPDGQTKIATETLVIAFQRLVIEDRR